MAIKLNLNLRAGEVDIVEIAKILLKSGVPVSRLDNDDTPTLIYAIETQNLELISLLIENGADVNLKITYNGVFPLYFAVELNNLEIIHLLISKGADVNNKTRFGCTALHKACCNKEDESIIKILLQNGARVSVENEYGNTPFTILKRYYVAVNKYDLMIREIAKQKFHDKLAVSKKDIDLIKNDPKAVEYFQYCTEELTKSSNIKFYASYSYYWVLKISINGRKKLANLSKNEEFVMKFRQNLDKFPCYQKDFQKIIEDAIKTKNESLEVESRLRIVFYDYLPDIVIRELADNLGVTDLPSDDEILDNLNKNSGKFEKVLSKRKSTLSILFVSNLGQKKF